MRFAQGVGSALPFLVGTLLLATVLSFVLTPLVRGLAHRLGMVDHPDERRVNTSPVPRGGGIAVAVACLAATLVFLVVNEATGSTIRPPSTIGTTELIALLGGGVLATVIGSLDDTFQLRARYQLAGQVFLAVGAILLGATPDQISSPFGDSSSIDMGGLVGAGFALLFILGMVNSINFIDGLDGLSSGIGLVAALTLGLISLTTAVGNGFGQPFVAILCFALVGALAGFLRWNFFPATVFVGTSGVLFVGYTLAILSILGTAKVAVAMLVLGVPIIDTFWIIVRRVAARRSPFAPDRGHIHHRLLDLGLSHLQTVILIYAICIVLGLMALFLPVSAQLVAFVALTLVTGLVFFVLTRRSVDSSTRASKARAALKAVPMASPVGEPTAVGPGHATGPSDPPVAPAPAVATDTAAAKPLDPALSPPGRR
jgi:UDP-GlcNAc:undecaprenyl-phosphate/decaprenyl-phosphate GlcNAc-1-phosphate transferase